VSARVDPIESALEAFEQLERRGGGTLIIVGPPDGLLDRLTATDRRVMRARVGYLDRLSPYNAWQVAFQTLFAPSDRSAEAVRRRLGPHASLAPLLKALLPVDFPESEATARLSSSARIERTRALIASLVATEPTLLVLNDAHWFDSATWAALGAVRTAAPDLILVIGTRTLPEPRPDTIVGLLERDDTRRVVIEPTPATPPLLSEPAALAKQLASMEPSAVRLQFATLAEVHAAADDPSTAIDYWERAGSAALRAGADREAAQCYESALRLEHSHGLVSRPARYAHWERNLAEARFRIGELRECEIHGRRALAHLGWPIPETTAGHLASLVRETVLYALHRSWPKRFGIREPMERKQRLWAARIIDRLKAIAIREGRSTRALDLGLRELNLSEPVGPSPELGRALATLSVFSGRLPIRRTGERWMARAIDAADASGDAGTLAWVRV